MNSSQPEVLLAGLSVRMLAEAAARAGWRPLAVDLFGDADLAAAAADHRVVGGRIDEGPDVEETLAALEALAAPPRRPVGLVLGSGFESRPEVVLRLSGRLPLLGSDADAVAGVKDPLSLAAVLARLGVPHPEVQTAAPADPAGWLVKRAGAAGGGHVRPAEGARARAGDYWQRRVDGRALSAAFLADGRGAAVLAFCATRADPTTAMPYRFGGVVGPVDAGPFAGEIAAALDQVAAGFLLRGLCGADLVVADGAWWLIEINPRPTAALEPLDRGSPALFGLHVAAAAGGLAPWRPPERPAGTAVVFARRRLTVRDVAMPDWIADRPAAGAEVPEGAPICSVRAEGASEDEVWALLEARGADAARLLGG